MHIANLNIKLCKSCFVCKIYPQMHINSKLHNNLQKNKKNTIHKTSYFFNF